MSDPIRMIHFADVHIGTENYGRIDPETGVSSRILDFLRRFRPFRAGTPSHDHLGDIFATLDAEKFQQCFAGWVAALTGAPADIIAIDGKTVRRSFEKKAG